jgi:hypothetical protein
VSLVCSLWKTCCLSSTSNGRRPQKTTSTLDSNPAAAPNHAGLHDLALVVFAVAALVQEEPSDALVEHYRQIAKVTLGLQLVLEKPSIVTIQVLHLTSFYDVMSGNDLKSETSTELTWSLVTLAVRLSQVAWACFIKGFSSFY